VLRPLLLRLSTSQTLKRQAARNPLARRMARRFTAGETLEDAVDAVRALNAQGISATVSYLGEHVGRAAEAEMAACHYLESVQAFSKAGVEANISIKLSQLGLDFDEPDTLSRARDILRAAKDAGDLVWVDMESSAYTARTLEMVEALQADGLPAGAVLQAYLMRTPADLERMATRSIPVRLCKGAYAEGPDVALQEGRAVSKRYRDLLRANLEQGAFTGIATHNTSLVLEARRLVQELRLAPDRYEFQMLYGVRRDLQRRLVRLGYPLRVYVPYGEQWYPYLMRRLAERPANALFVLKSLLPGR
jgi:proline dehydrogenase